MERRDFLRKSAALGAAGMAGCTGDKEPEDDGLGDDSKVTPEGTYTGFVKDIQVQNGNIVVYRHSEPHFVAYNDRVGYITPDSIALVRSGRVLDSQTCYTSATQYKFADGHDGAGDYVIELHGDVSNGAGVSTDGDLYVKVPFTVSPSGGVSVKKAQVYSENVNFNNDN